MLVYELKLPSYKISQALSRLERWGEVTRPPAVSAFFKKKLRSKKEAKFASQILRLPIESGSRGFNSPPLLRETNIYQCNKLLGYSA